MPKRKARSKTSSARRGPKRTKRTGTSSLARMTLDALMSLRDNVDRIISTRAKAERAAIEKQLARLSGFGGGQPERKSSKRKSALMGRKVPPKYRNPANPSETWAGRGVRPRWLQAQLKRGRKLEQFAIVRGRPGRKKATGKRGKIKAPSKAVPAEVAA
jgi:DNA-binding protein H-NS